MITPLSDSSGLSIRMFIVIIALSLLRSPVFVVYMGPISVIEIQIIIQYCSEFSFGKHPAAHHCAAGCLIGEAYAVLDLLCCRYSDGVRP